MPTTYQEVYQSILSPKHSASVFDQKIFKELNTRKITTRECFEWFMKNNLGYVDESYWNEKEFRNWVRSLGY